MRIEFIDPMNLRILLAFTSLLTMSLHAETRAWKSPDGPRAIQAEFIKRDATSVTVRLDRGKELTRQSQSQITDIIQKFISELLTDFCLSLCS